MAAVIAPIIGAATSILGGLLGGSAAKKAAGAQAGAAYTAGGKILQTAEDANKGVSAAEGNANTLVLGARDQAVNGVTDATNAGVGRSLASIGAANNYLDPFSTMGTNSANALSSMLAPGGDLMKNFTAADMEKYDPGYQFRIDQGAKQLQRSAAAHGDALGGAAAASLANYSQSAASSEYNTAFQRFQQQQQQKYGMLAGTTQMGMAASGQEAGNTMQGNEFASDFGLRGAGMAGNFGMSGSEWAGQNEMQSNEYQANNFMDAAKTWGSDIMGAGNAIAAGDMGKANAWSSGLSGIGNAGINYTLLNMMAADPSGLGRKGYVSASSPVGS